LFFIIFINKIKFSLKILPLKKGEAEIQKLFNEKAGSYLQKPLYLTLNFNF